MFLVLKHEVFFTLSSTCRTFKFLFRGFRDRVMSALAQQDYWFNSNSTYTYRAHKTEHTQCTLNAHSTHIPSTHIPQCTDTHKPYTYTTYTRTAYSIIYKGNTWACRYHIWCTWHKHPHAHIQQADSMLTVEQTWLAHTKHVYTTQITHKMHTPHDNAFNSHTARTTI